MPSNESTLPRFPDFRLRAQLTEWIDEPCSRDQLRSCLRDLARVNGWLLAFRPLLRWLRSVVPAHVAQPIRILDVGCGYGDGLRRIERWAHARRIQVELTGLDVNPDAVAIAAEATPPSSRIHWAAADIFTYAPAKPVHIVVSSLFTHHLSEPEIVRFLQWMEQNATLGWFINDLSRAPIPYHLFRAFAKLMRLHPFVQHDGAISIARSFIAQDWQRMCTAAGLDEHAVSIQAHKPARLCVERTKPQ
ncbi:MAG: methyltransferase domain-containing protein [Terracidiphilus sp.]